MSGVNHSDRLAGFTETQKTRVELMRRIAQTLTEATRENFVLKGGTALLLAYGLPRYSTDLDYDGKDRHIDIVKLLETGATRAGVQIDSLTLRKDTETVKRFMLHYKGSENDPLKIEISFRQSGTIDEHDVKVVDGIRVYTIEKLTELKAAAFLNRTKARDAYDIAYILEKYPSAIQSDLLSSIARRVDELTLDTLAAIMRDEEILSVFDPVEIVVNMQSRIEAMLEKPSIIAQIREHQKAISEQQSNGRKPKSTEPEL